MAAMPTRHTNDLFELFPDLPWTRLRTAAEQIAAVRKRVAETRLRANANIERQRLKSARLRIRISARRRR
jgi:hypothetical protein